MNRRGFVATLAATGLAGCSMRSEVSGRATISASAGDWNQFRGGSGRRGHTSTEYPSNGSSTVDTGPEIRSVTAPVLHEGDALVATPDAVVAVGLGDLTEQYRIPIEAQPTLPPAVGSGVIALVSERGVVGYDVRDRTETWTLAAERTFGDAAAPAAFGSHFVVQDSNRIRLVAHETGDVVWAERFDANVRGFAADTGTVVVNRRTNAGSELLGLDPATGDVEWNETVESSRIQPALDDHAYVISEYGRLVALDDGTVEWTVETELSDPASLSVGDRFLVAGPDASGEYVGVDRQRAAVAWRRTVQFGNDPVLAGEQVFVPSPNDGVVCLDATDGTPLQGYPEVRFVERLVPSDDGMLCMQQPDGGIRYLGLATS